MRRFTAVPMPRIHSGVRFMTNKAYYETITAMEKKGVDKEYINGWACGFLHNPKREEQRLNDAYNTGYDDGHAGKTDGFTAFVKK